MPTPLDILKRLVSYPTSNNPKENIKPKKDILNYVKDELLQPLDYQSILFEENDYWSIVSYLKRNTPTILFIGHCDVVPPGPNWATDPFSLTIDEDKAYGRGTADMKGAVSVMLSLAEFFKEESDSTVIFAINLDEESGGKNGAGRLMKIFEEKGIVPDYIINGDAIGLQIVNRRRNSYAITLQLPEVIRTVRGRKESKIFKTEIAGNRTMHAAYFMREIDIHCMDEASDFIRENSYLVTELKGAFVKNNVLPSEVSIKYIIPEEEGSEMWEYDENLTNFLHSVTEFKDVDIPSEPSAYGINLTFNYYRNENDLHLCYLDLRIMSKNDVEIEKYFDNFVESSKIKAKIDLKGSIGPVETPKESPLIQKSIKVAQAMNLSPEPIEMGGATDSRWFSYLGIPTIEFGPLGGNVHGSNEYVEISSLERVSKFYQKLYIELTKVVDEGKK
ncbi:MAG: M20/M25/M40 family metallo-hydrolase [Candidatus Heimdallarchaeota archaeon]|nr:M20/M25/M40 family metallo-hydrolase [Candidatus Heimdallarchaeota archaeon]